MNYSKRWFLPLLLDFLIAAKLMHLVSDVVFEALDVLLVGLSSKQLRQIIIHRNGVFFSVFSLAWFQKLESVLLIEWDGFF